MYLWDLRCSGILRSVQLWLLPDVSGQPIAPIFKCQEILLFIFFFDFFILENANETSFRKVGKEYRSTRGTITEDSRSRLLRGESRKSRRLFVSSFGQLLELKDFETLIPADVQVRVFWTVMAWSLVHRRVYQRCLCLQGTVKITL